MLALLTAAIAVAVALAMPARGPGTALEAATTSLGFRRFQWEPNVPYDGKFTFTRDIGDYMEWSDQDFWPVNITNDAYRFAINYIMYGMTH